MAEDGPRYEAEPLRCKACQAREITRRQFTASSETEAGGDTAGLIVSVQPVEEEPDEQPPPPDAPEP